MRSRAAAVLTAIAVLSPTGCPADPTTAEAGTASVEFAESPTRVRTTTNIGPVEVRVSGTTAYALDIHTSAGGSTVNVDQNPASTHASQSARMSAPRGSHAWPDRPARPRHNERQLWRCCYE